MSTFSIDDARTALRLSYLFLCNDVFALHRRWQEESGDDAVTAWSELLAELNDPQALDALVKLAKMEARRGEHVLPPEAAGDK